MTTEDGPADGDARGRFARFVDRNTLPLTLLCAFVGGCAVVVALARSFAAMLIAPALLWSIAFGAIGVLLGFIFAIPRVPARPSMAPRRGPDLKPAHPDDPTEDEDDDEGPVASSANDEVNSNLVEVSDWLTKIIVGVGLVEAKSLPAYGAGLARFVAPGIGLPIESAVPIVGGLMLYFTVLGFLSGYLLTRVYIAVLFKSVDVQIRRQSQTLQLESGRKIGVRKLALLQQSAIEDVQRTVANLPQAQLKAASAVQRGGIAKRIVWYDEHPENNALLVDQMRHLGFQVDQNRFATATMDLYIGNVDLVICDMARTSGPGSGPNAGIALVRTVRQSWPDIPILIYCTAELARLYGAEADAAGAALVTSSGTQLLAQVKELAQAPPPAPASS